MIQRGCHGDNSRDIAKVVSKQAVKVVMADTLPLGSKCLLNVTMYNDVSGIRQ
jgi:hypothetical protein